MAAGTYLDCNVWVKVGTDVCAGGGERHHLRDARKIEIYVNNEIKVDLIFLFLEYRMLQQEITHYINKLKTKY